ncbi:chromate transporter [Mesomycoplasma neurolyticum]|uniref:Chromate transporter n=1 Tax=Mesomycoplasma neurolyticum TaxID=2120 RepID=A0A449A5P3_9BACT|nr:chromate transporter [Mesomycoplasma neurolyticum]VEU59547.1 chromate transporter [Mesomycoplasma neurolyticum]
MKKDFWKVFFFIIKCTFVGFGGGNAIMPVIKEFAVNKYKWISDEEFNDGIVACNLIPGPAVIEMLSYIAIKKLGKFKGSLVVLIAVIPHVTLALILYYLASYLPLKYLYVINVGVISALIGIIAAFAYRFLKSSMSQLNLIVWVLLFLFTLLFCLFIPAPFNIPAIPLICIIFSIFILEIIKTKKSKGKK